MPNEKLHLSSMYGSTARDSGQWEPGDRPALNTWYPLKRGDDYYKIILQNHGSFRAGEPAALYRVVSMRGADVGFDLTLAMARVMIMKETRRA